MIRRQGLRPVSLAVAVMAMASLAGCTGSVDDRPDADSEAGTSADTSPVGGDAPVGPGWVVDFDRYGPIPLGLELDDARDAAAVGIDGPVPPEGCGYASIRRRGEGLGLMVVDGRLVRVDVSPPADVATERGARIGDTAERIHALYGERLEARPHKYTDGQYLIASPPGGGPYRIVFEVEDGRVQTYRAGRVPEVEWVEGCG